MGGDTSDAAAVATAMASESELVASAGAKTTHSYSENAVLVNVAGEGDIQEIESCILPAVAVHLLQK